MLNVIMLSVVMLSAVAPHFRSTLSGLFHKTSSGSFTMKAYDHNYKGISPLTSYTLV
jgi:hypothetical protein